ncbi:MAG: outer membrane protein transport protein [Deltaproteobacteria bacterium]|nr:outer membrane protein transport protein [Deltaproteobacteria bacterium]MDQ3295690.1 outer membrane protein transport protein [Myxococcota bacterium]
MKTLRTTLFTALSLGALAGSASANAFNINEHDARVTGRGGATAASNTEPSSIVFNPGGIAINEGTQVALGTSFYFAEGSYENDSTPKTTTDSGMSLVPNVYLTSRLHDMVAVGLGLHFPFGLAVSWPDNHTQSDVIQDQTLKTYFITPSVGLNLHEQVPGLSVGAGIDIVPATIELEQTISFGDVQGNAHLGGDAVGFGARVGVMYHPEAVEGLKLGVTYRSPVKLEFEGKGDFDIAPEFREQLPADGDIQAEITLPQSVAGGVAYSPIRALEFELNAVWINWKQAFKDGDLTINLPDGAVTSSPQDYKNTVTWRLGVEYRLAQHQASVRAGFIYDPTPIPTTTLTARLPDIDRKNVTLGASKQFGDYGVHLGLLWVTPGERDTSDEMYRPAFKGRYGVQAFVASLGVSGAFGAK